MTRLVLDLAASAAPPAENQRWIPGHIGFRCVVRSG